MKLRFLRMSFAISTLHVLLFLAAVSVAAQEAGNSVRKEPASKAPTAENEPPAVSAPAAISIDSPVAEKPTSETAPLVAPGSPTARPVQSSSDGWNFQLSPYLFMMGMKGTAGARGLTSELDVKFVDIIDEVNFGFMGAFEARKDRFVFLTDMLYANLSDSDETPGPLFSSVKVDLKLFILDPEVGYRLAQSDKASLDVMGGIRYWHLKTTVDFREGILPATQGEQAKNWVDAVGGLRGRARLSDSWFVFGKADLGAGGSDFTWQLFGGVGVDVSKNVSLGFGYRHLSVDYDDETGFLFDVALKGPVLGLSFRF